MKNLLKRVYALLFIGFIGLQAEEITLNLNDDSTVKVEKKVAATSVTLKNLMEDIDDPEQAVSLDITKDQWDSIESLMKSVSESQDQKSLEENLLNKIEQKKLSLDDQINLINTLDFLDISLVLQAAEKNFVKYIKNNIDKIGENEIKKMDDNLPVQIQEEINAQWIEWMSLANDKEVASVAWSPNGKLLAASFDKGIIKIWDINTPVVTTINAVNESGHYPIAWFPDSTTIIAGFDDGSIKFWNISDKKNPKLVKTIEASNSGRVDSLALSPDGKKLVVNYNAIGTKVWDISPSDPVQLLSLTGKFVSWSPDGTKIATGIMNGSLSVWNSKGGALVSSLVSRASSAWLCYDWSPVDTKIVLGHRDTLMMWNYLSGKPPQTLLKVKENNDFRSLGWSPDGTKIAAGLLDGTLQIWNAQQEKLIMEFEPHSDSIDTLQWSPDSKWLATGSEDKIVKIWTLSFSLIEKVILLKNQKGIKLTEYENKILKAIQ